MELSLPMARLELVHVHTSYMKCFMIYEIRLSDERQGGREGGREGGGR